MRQAPKASSGAIVIVTLFIIWPIAKANNIYISQTAVGSANGNSCANAYPVTYFNNASNWTSGTPSSMQIGAGSIVHLCGVIASELAFHGSGSSGNVIELLFESGASVQISPGADSNGAINLGGYSYLLIDGGANTPCGWNTAANASEGPCNGQVRNMLYGSPGAACPGGACTTQPTATTGNLLQTYGGANIEVRNLQVGPSYIHNSASDNGGTQCLSFANTNNVNIHDNKLHDGVWCIVVSFGSGTTSSWTVSNNELYFDSHMVALAGSGSGNLNGFTFNGNYAHDMYVWDTTADTNHADGIHLYGGTGTAQNITVYNNIFGGNTGGDVTGQWFSEAMGGTASVVLFNNVFNVTTSPNIGASNYTMWALPQCSACYAYNNSVNNGSGSGMASSMGYSTYSVSAAMENNVFEGSSTLFNINTNLVSIAPFDYNAYGPAGSGNVWICKGSYYGGSQFSSWQSACGEGTHSFYKASGLGLNSGLQPQAGSAVIGAGVNVCSINPAFCTNYPAIKNDIAGTARPSAGAWDVGAYQYSAVGSSGPTAPTFLSGIGQ